MKPNNFNADSSTLIDLGLASPTGGVGGGGAKALDDLTDVTITSPADGAVLTYDTGSSQWIDAAPAAGSEATVEHGDLGAAVTLDLGDGTWHSGLLTADCAITVTGFTVDAQGGMTVKLVQDDTAGWAVTWDADILWTSDDQPGQDAGDVTFFVIFSDEGDAALYGTKVGGGVAASSVTDETTWGIAPAVGTDVEYARQDHTHGTPDEPTGTTPPFDSDYVATYETTSSTGYADLATSGPSVTVDISASGIALVGYRCQFDLDGTFASVAVSGASTVAANDAWAVFGLSGTSFGTTHVFTGLATGSTTFKLQYRVGSGTHGFQRREIWVMAL